MITPGAADEWDFTVPDDAAQLLAELRRHGAEPGQRVRVAVVKDDAGGKRKSVRGALVGKVPKDELLTRDDFEAAHRANIEAAERRYGAIDR
jgi:FKBP-type peptidyl-prolyl cis-trans isomerase 2